MEASDPFATAAPADEADPFAEVEAGAPDMPASDDVAEPPIVNREGEPVGASEAGRRMAAEAAAKQEEAAAAAPADEAPAEATTATPAPETETAADDGGEPPEAPPEAPPAPQEPEDASQGPADQPESAPIVLRRYKLLYATGPQQWSEAPLDADSPHAERDEQGELWLKARNADHARRLAWVVFNRPEQGVQCVPVAASSWKPRIVKKAAPAPERERLEIV